MMVAWDSYGSRQESATDMKISLSLSLSAAILLSGCSGGSGSSSPATGPVGQAVGDVLSFPFVGQKDFLVIVVRLLDRPPLFESEQGVLTAKGEAELTAILQQVHDACDENSFGALDVRFTQTALLQIPKTAAEYENDPKTALVRIRADAIEAARLAGFEADQFDREVLFAPGVWPAKAGRGWVRTIWMPNTFAAVLYHEVGHTLGWGHANFWDGDPVDAGTEINYGDIFDPMGTGKEWFPFKFRHSEPSFKVRAGWLDDSFVQTVTSSGTYSLSDVENPDLAVGPSALRIRRDAQDDYWIFHRQEEELVRGGILIVRQGTNPFQGTLLLDMDRSTGGSPRVQVEDAELLPGKTFDDSSASMITITNDTPAGGGPLQVTIELSETRQLGLDQLPLIQVVDPPMGAEPIHGLYTFDVAVADPDVGPTDGEGVTSVKLEILDPVTDPFQAIASTELFGPPYVWSFDTTTLADAKYFLAVTAKGAGGGSRTVWSRFLVDNLTAAGE